MRSCIWTATHNTITLHLVVELQISHLLRSLLATRDLNSALFNINWQSIYEHMKQKDINSNERKFSRHHY
uniref:Uncharacterized protein n=1 Tax=Trichobilharzia regenti TaxID=157069 RepID=A0AA85JTV1_TRIRE|nr:unnamed protein product [Trichobilharzia regenti]